MRRRSAEHRCVHVQPRVWTDDDATSGDPLIMACGPYNGGKWAIPLDEIALGAAT